MCVVYNEHERHQSIVLNADVVGIRMRKLTARIPMRVIKAGVADFALVIAV